MLTDAQGLPILDQFSEEGFIDCIFKAVNLKSDRNFFYFNLLASHEERTVGFAVKLIKDVGRVSTTTWTSSRPTCIGRV